MILGSALIEVTDRRSSKAQDTVIVMQAKLSSGVLPQMDTHNENQLNDYLGELRQSFVALDVCAIRAVTTTLH